MTHSGGMPKEPLRVLIVEDSEDDLLLLLSELDRGGYAVSHRRVQTTEAFGNALQAEDWQLVVSDFSLPTMTAHDVLSVLNATRPDLPCIVLSGTISEEAAVDVLRAGARDFVVKDLLARLLPAVARELREGHERHRRHEAEAALQEMRRRMQFALESVEVGIWEWDLSSGKVVWSEVKERLFGFQPGGFGGTFDAFVATVHPEDRAEVLRRIEQATVDRRDFRMEFRSRWPDASVHWIVSIGRIVCEDGGAAVRSVGVAMDVTAQKRLEEQVHQTQKMESIGQLAGGIAHDFNNLLTVIAGCCDMVAERVAPDSAAAEPLEEIRTAAMSAAALTRQLLTFSRRQIVSPVVLDLNDVVTSFENILRRLVEESVHLDFVLDPRPQRVRVDPGQIQQVLLNLVANARDAMPEGGTVTIQTSAATIDEDPGRMPGEISPGAYAVLSVTDTGSGISPETQARLFEPFFTTKLGRGTGLGLATVYGIVKQSGGHIVVESEPGAGTTFRIYLPVTSARDAAPAEEKPKAPDLAGNETVLVVEDNAALRRLNEVILKRHGYHVLVAANGADARRICEEYPQPIHLALLDVVMPGESGPAIGEWISRNRPGTKILYMSGYAGDQVDRSRLLAAGCSFLQKPFNASQLARAVREILSPHKRLGTT